MSNRIPETSLLLQENIDLNKYLITKDLQLVKRGSLSHLFHLVICRDIGKEDVCRSLETCLQTHTVTIADRSAIEKSIAKIMGKFFKENGAPKCTEICSQIHLSEIDELVKAGKIYKGEGKAGFIPLKDSKDRIGFIGFVKEGPLLENCSDERILKELLSFFKLEERDSETFQSYRINMDQLELFKFRLKQKIIAEQPPKTAAPFELSLQQMRDISTILRNDPYSFEGARKLADQASERRAKALGK